MLTAFRRGEPALLERQETMTDTPIPARTPAEGFPGFLMTRAVGCPFGPPHALRKMQAEVPITRIR